MVRALVFNILPASSEDTKSAPCILTGLQENITVLDLYFGSHLNTSGQNPPKLLTLKFVYYQGVTRVNYTLRTIMLYRCA